MTETTIASGMRHITKVRLENFQSHSDSTIHLEEGINLITGSSDAGKSALLRGIHWALHNKPSGKGFIKHGSTEARVTIWFSDGTTVQRIKGDSRNAVLIRKADGTESAYDRFGNEYPDEVLQALGNPPSDEKHGAISYAEQMAPYFLVSLTPTELPRTLSELTRLDDLQEAAENLAKRAREKDRQVKQSQDRIVRFDQELEAFSGLEADIIRQKALDKRCARVQQLASKLETATKIVQSYKEVMQQGKAEKEALNTLAGIVNLSPQTENLRDRATGIAHRKDFYEKAMSVEAEIESTEKLMREAAALSQESVQQRLHDINSSMEQIVVMTRLYQECKQVSTQGAAASKEKQQSLQDLDQLNKEYEKVKSQIAEAGMWCDACDRPLDT